MPSVITVGDAAWSRGIGSAPPPGLAAALESGAVLFFPNLPFEIDAAESALFSQSLATTAKNISFDPRSGRLGGIDRHGAAAVDLRELVAGFSRVAGTFAGEILPDYRDCLEIGRTSFRPIEIAGRPSSWRKDDTRLHVDSFPATPVGDRRILRVFSNVNPHGQARTWRIGDQFEAVARRFAGRLRIPWPGSAPILHLLRLTKAPRSAYDALMLQLHDLMKGDTGYQAAAPQTRFDFPAGSTWMAFTDQVSHAAMAGRFQLEQTFLLPVDAMLDPGRSPLRILERLVGRRLA
ncbi:MAG: Kdo hydroxylase family protein [Acidobacteriota bacterium]